MNISISELHSLLLSKWLEFLIESVTVWVTELAKEPATKDGAANENPEHTEREIPPALVKSNTWTTSF